MPSWELSGGRQAVLQCCLQDEAVRGQQHVEGLQLRVCEQKQLLAQYRKEGRRMKKTLATYEVGPAARQRVHSRDLATLAWPMLHVIISLFVRSIASARPLVSAASGEQNIGGCPDRTACRWASPASVSA